MNARRIAYTAAIALAVVVSYEAYKSRGAGAPAVRLGR